MSTNSWRSSSSCASAMSSPLVSPRCRLPSGVAVTSALMLHVRILPLSQSRNPKANPHSARSTVARKASGLSRQGFPLALRFRELSSHSLNPGKEEISRGFIIDRRGFLSSGECAPLHPPRRLRGREKAAALFISVLRREKEEEKVRPRRRLVRGFWGIWRAFATGGLTVWLHGASRRLARR